jgi:hypothetical protein
MAKNIRAIYAEGAREFARQLIGRDFTDEELAAGSRRAGRCHAEGRQKERR